MCCNTMSRVLRLHTPKNFKLKKPNFKKTEAASKEHHDLGMSGGQGGSEGGRRKASWYIYIYILNWSQDTGTDNVCSQLFGIGQLHWRMFICIHIYIHTHIVIHISLLLQMLNDKFCRNLRTSFNWLAFALKIRYIFLFQPRQGTLELEADMF